MIGLRKLAFGAAVMLAPITTLAAQEATEPQDEVTVEEGQVQGSTGRLAVNLAAGTNNQQLSAATIAIGEVALSGTTSAQHNANPLAGDRATHIAVGARAFANTSGLASVNITAGHSNQSANIASLAISTGLGSGGALTDAALAQSRAPTKPNGGLATGPATANDSIDIADDALSGGSGLFQVNLIGGERNASANTFVLSVSGNDN